MLNFYTFVSRVDIEVIDLNDNVPEFEVDLYNISIIENLPKGFSILQVNAIDRDQVCRCQKVCSLLGFGK